jgi:hypothetical protein
VRRWRVHWRWSVADSWGSEVGRDAAAAVAGVAVAVALVVVCVVLCERARYLS